MFYLHNICGSRIGSTCKVTEKLRLVWSEMQKGIF